MRVYGHLRVKDSMDMAKKVHWHGSPAIIMLECIGSRVARSRARRESRLRRVDTWGHHGPRMSTSGHGDDHPDTGAWHLELTSYLYSNAESLIAAIDALYEQVNERLDDCSVRLWFDIPLIL